MDAGQRYCFLAINNCLERYPLDDVLVAIVEHVRQTGRGPDRETKQQKVLDEAARQIEEQRLKIKAAIGN